MSSEFKFVMCDADAAGVERAEYSATLDTRELVMCSHHTRENRAAMESSGWEIALIPSLPVSLTGAENQCDLDAEILDEIENRLRKGE